MNVLATLAICAVVASSIIASLGFGPQLFGFVNRIPGGDLTGHFLLMGLLSFAVNLRFSRNRLRGRRLGVLGCTGLVLAAVTLEELTQKWIPARSFSMADLVASYTGVLTWGALAALLLWRGQRANMG